MLEEFGKALIELERECIVDRKKKSLYHLRFQEIYRNEVEGLEIKKIKYGIVVIPTKSFLERTRRKKIFK